MNKNTWLMILTGLACLARLLVKTFVPDLILPGLDVAFVCALSLAACLLEAWFSRKETKACPVWDFVYGALAFGVLPLACGWSDPTLAAVLAVAGGVGHLVLSFLFGSLRQRLKPGSYAAPAAAAFLLFLAFQGFTGFIGYYL